MRTHSINFLVAIILLTTTSFALAKALLPKSANVPGGVVIVDLDASANTAPKVYYQENRALVMRDPKQPNKWISVIGIPLDAKPGMHQIKIFSHKSASTKNFMVQSKDYPHQHLRFVDTRKTSPSIKDRALIEEQYLKTIATYANWVDQPITSAVLSLPVRGRRSSAFGLKRVINSVPQNPHTGLDIVAPKGTPVKASQAGKVINVGNYFYTGKIVFLDHGQGFITSYCHLDRVIVKIGQVIRQGQTLGTVGSTGRATGPHLHWSVSLNGVRVDPEWFIDE